MDKLSVAEIIDSTFHYFSHNSSYAVPEKYDLKPGDATWVLSSAYSCFTMQIGMALIEAGMVSKKNQVNVMMKNIVDVCAGGFSFWIVGFGLMYGRGEFTNPFFGAGDFFVDAKVSDPLLAQVFTFYIIQLSYATTATTIASGGAAERFRFTSYIMFSFMYMLVYSIGAGWVWGQHGWLKNIGAIDFSGAAPIHIIGGASGELKTFFIAKFPMIEGFRQVLSLLGTSARESIATSMEMNYRQ